jgi:hypothetical protein
MTDQLREAARALLDYLDAGGVTYGRPLVAEGRIADLRAALDAAPPAVDVERLADVIREELDGQNAWEWNDDINGVQTGFDGNKDALSDVLAAAIAAEYARLGDTR